MVQEYKECEECRTRAARRSYRCDACGGRLVIYRRGMTIMERVKSYAIAISVGVLAAVIGELLRRFN